MPVAIYVRDLRDQVVERLRDTHPDLDAAGIKIPSDSWISYQFSPNILASHATSLQYTGALNIKHKVQSRTLRANHLNSHYVACLLKKERRKKENLLRRG